MTDCPSPFLSPALSCLFFYHFSLSEKTRTAHTAVFFILNEVSMKGSSLVAGLKLLLPILVKPRRNPTQDYSSFI